MSKPKHKFLKTEGEVRIIGGRFGGRKLKYDGDPGTRPMKDRTREAVFNLVGTELDKKHAIDLFGGTGAMAIEALSRGATSATVIEQHFPMARTLRENLQRLEIAEMVELISGDTFAWFKRGPTLPQRPWVVFCCPPYALYQQLPEQLMAMLEELLTRAAAGSLFVVEYDDRFTAERLPSAPSWDLRQYPPATIGVLRKDKEDN